MTFAPRIVRARQGSRRPPVRAMLGPVTERNVLGGELQPCGTDPMTGFFRDGCCSTGPEDLGSHTICAVVTAEFLEHQRGIGNDLSTPVPAFRFPGLVPGRPVVRHGSQLGPRPREGVAAPVVLAATHEAVLRIVPLAALSSTPSTCPRTSARSSPDQPSTGRPSGPRTAMLTRVHDDASYHGCYDAGYRAVLVVITATPGR